MQVEIAEIATEQRAVKSLKFQVILDIVLNMLFQLIELKSNSAAFVKYYQSVEFDVVVYHKQKYAITIDKVIELLVRVTLQRSKGRNQKNHK